MSKGGRRMQRMTRARSLWGWGWADRFPRTTTHAAASRSKPPRCSGSPSRRCVLCRPSRAFACPSRGSRRRPRSPRSSPATASSRPCTPTARLPRRRPRLRRGLLRRARRRRLAAATRTTSPPSSRGRCRRRERLAVIPFGGGTSVVGGVEGPGGGGWRGARSPWICARWTACSRSTSSRARRAHPGGDLPDRTSSSSSPRTEAHVLRHFPAELRALDARRLDPRRAPAATSRRSTRTWTTSWSRCAW